MLLFIILGILIIVSVEILIRYIVARNISCKLIGFSIWQRAKKDFDDTVGDLDALEVIYSSDVWINYSDYLEQTRKIMWHLSAWSAKTVIKDHYQTYSQKEIYNEESISNILSFYNKYIKTCGYISNIISDELNGYNEKINKGIIDVSFIYKHFVTLFELDSGYYAKKGEN